MKMMTRTIFSAMAALVLLGNSAMAQTKIATVDVSRLFKEYYKTKLAQEELNRRRQQIDKDESGMLDDLKTANTDYQQMLDESDDQALSSDERSQKKQAADAKYKEIEDSKAALDQYDRSAKSNLSEQLQRMHDKIVGEIQAAVASTAKTGGYTMVFDVSAQSAANTPTLIYSSGDVDLTDQVLKQLNAGAPIDTTTIESTPADTSATPPLSAPPPLTPGASQ
jgi:Skp family chaperone for outer membrane proteins